MNRGFVFAAGFVLAAAMMGQPAPAPNDYSDAKAWLCRPGVKGACDVDLTTTVVSAGGGLKREEFKADPNAPIDCFYVYPTVSTDPGLNSDMTPDPAELNVIRQQFARFGSKCRLFAPMYRQITLAGLRQILGGAAKGVTLDHGLQYDDVRDAFHYYLEHDNGGRGFVLVGHSQGSFILAELIRQEIDGKPLQARMISAMIPGATQAVPVGKDAGGSFQHVPLCHKATDTGCVIAYSAFRSTIPPPANTRFGKVTKEGTAAACVNPADLDTSESSGGELHSYLAAEGRTITGTTPPKPWVSTGKAIDTPWVSVPGMLTARCTSNENATYLEITVHPDPQGVRASDMIGDIGAPGQVAADWGLHLIDVNLAMGNLVEIAGQQAKVWMARRPTPLGLAKP